MKRRSTRRRGGGGRKPQSVGAAFQERIERANQFYATKWLAWVHPTGPKVKFFSKPDGGYTARSVGVGPPDYVGTLAGGRAVMIEAKTTENKERLTLPKKTLHQFKMLKQAQRIAATENFGYLVEWRYIGVFCWYPIIELELDEKGRLVLVPSEGYVVRPLKGFPDCPDWLTMTSAAVYWGDGAPADMRRKLGE